MNKTEDETSTDGEESIIAPKKLINTPRIKAIIDSESEDKSSGSENKSVTPESKNVSENSESDGEDEPIEDSFNCIENTKETNHITQSLHQLSFEVDNDIRSSTKIDDTTDDDDEISIPEISDDEVNASENINEKKKEDEIGKEKSQENSQRSTSPPSTVESECSAEIIEQSFSIVEVSSEEETPAPGLKQTSIKAFLKSETLTPKQKVITPAKKIPVSQSEYEQQSMKVHNIEAELLRARNALRIIKVQTLPDKGKSLQEKEQSLTKMLEDQRKKLNNMVIDQNKPSTTVANKIEVAWDEIQAGVNAVGPRTFGKIGVTRFNAEKQLAVETLDHLHKSLETCPTENDLVDDPKGLKIPLMPHQRRALAWLLWREKQKPSGGLLADDMGLGKTLTMISLVMKSRELNLDDSEKENYRSKYSGGTLVVCPASLMNQWSGEIERRTKRGILGFEVHHGPKREEKPKRLAQHDVVITTYAIVLSEYEKNKALFGIRWRRIILDEAHQIRNHKSKTAEAVFKISGKSRWALTGTPVHNKELDMYAILKFLRCSPFDDLQVWKHWVGSKSTGGEMRLHAVISSLMLRRTKAELMAKGSLQSLPDRNWELIPVKLEKDEMDVYQRVLIFSRTLFAQFLHQRAEKNQDVYNMRFNDCPPDPNGEYFKMRNKLLKLNRVKEISQHEILVLLLRLRQICCHPSLIIQMLQGDEDLGDAEDYEEPEEMNLLEQLNKLNLNGDDEYHPTDGLSDENVGLKEASKGFLNPSNPVFRAERPSSKTKALIKLLRDTISRGDKAVVVSQWTTLLNLIAIHLRDEGVIYDSLNGSIPVSKRMPIVDNFNDPNSDTKVLLLSLTAGGVGLNLVGANHLFLLDLHWNPQLESQAQDRIYRMGQKKPIFVYKFMAEDTIEERIKGLQDRKLEIADSMLTGSKRVSDSKLTLQDLKVLFDFK